MIAEDCHVSGEALLLVSLSLLHSRGKFGPSLGYAALMGEGKRAMAKPHDGSQSICSDVASVPSAHIPLVKAPRQWAETYPPSGRGL